MTRENIFAGLKVLDVASFSWARSGLMHVAHDASGPPSISAPGIGDHATASTLYGAVVDGSDRTP